MSQASSHLNLSDDAFASGDELFALPHAFLALFDKLATETHFLLRHHNQILASFDRRHSFLHHLTALY